MTRRTLIAVLAIGLLLVLGPLATAGAARGPAAPESSPPLQGGSPPQPLAVAEEPPGPKPPEPLPAPDVPYGFLWVESFDGTTFPPANWGQTYVVGTSNWDRQTSGTNPTIAPHSGVGMARWNSYSIASGNSTRLYTPIVNLTGLTGPSFRFWMSHDTGYSTTNDRIQPQISTDGGTTWADLGGAIIRYDATCTTPCWREHTSDLTAFIGQSNVRLGLVGISGFGNNIFVDDVSVYASGPDFATSSKSAPAQVVIGQQIPYVIRIANTGDLPANAATMTDAVPAGTTYVPGSVNCTAGSCSYASGTVSWSGVVAIGEVVTVTFAVDTTGLTCGTRIVNTAIINDPALPGGPVSREAVTTAITTPPLLEESFDGTVFPPANWGQTNITGTSNWDRQTSGTNPTIAPHSGVGMARWNSYGIASGNATRLYSPIVNLAGMIAPRLRFWMSHDTGYSTANDRIQPQISTDGGTTWADLGSAVLRYDAACGTACWKEHVVDLTAYIGQSNVRLGLVGISAFGNNIFVDDVAVAEPWAPCPYVAIGPDQSGMVCQGNTLAYTLTASNMTSAPDTLNLTTAGVWPASLNPSSLALGAGGSATTALGVYVPWAATPGETDMTTATATGQISGLSSQAHVLSRAVLATGYTDLANLPAGRGTRDHSAVYYNGKLYKIGGWDSTAARPWVDIYDIATNTWSAGADMPAGRYWLECVEIGGLIYCAGGWSGSAGTTTLYIYDPVANSWTTGAALPANRYAYAGVALGGKYYVLGGYTTTYTNSMVVYDPVANTWSAGPNMNGVHRQGAAGAIGGLIYIAGGLVSSGTVTNVTEVYDPVANSWSLRTPLPAAGWVRAADAVVYNRFLLLAGGYSADSTASNAALAYDAVENAWFWLPTMNHLLYSAGGASDGTSFWIVSGRLYEGGVWGYSLYTTLMTNQCPTCTPVTGADFTWAPTTPLIGETTTFTGTVAGGTPAITYDWNFGDGTTGTGQVVTHAYAAPGIYSVVLTAANCDGANVSTATHDVTVLGIPAILVNPTSYALTVPLGYPNPVVQTMTISNPGSADLVWDIVEAPGVCAVPGDIPWLSTSPVSGTIAPAGSQPVDVTFANMAVLPVGVYTGTLCVNSNDPANPQLALPVTLTIRAPTAVTVTGLTSSAMGGLWLLILVPPAAVVLALLLRRRR